MNYHRIYDGLMAKRRVDQVEGYGELHHIVPKCMGGDNSKENLVRLTAREHIVAHILLTKMYPENLLLKYALTAMTMNANGLRDIDTKYLGLAREARSKIAEVNLLKGREPGFTHSESTRKKISDTMKGREIFWTECQIEKRAAKRRRPVIAKSDNETLRFSSMAEASRAGYLSSAVSRCCNGKLPKYKGFVWQFADRN